jgi:hypothetical protein
MCRPSPKNDFSLEVVVQHVIVQCVYSVHIFSVCMIVEAAKVDKQKLIFQTLQHFFFSRQINRREQTFIPG